MPYPARRLVLAEIPASALTPAVTKIEASDNQIQEVKADIAGAANLEELLLYKNKIKTVDPAIGQLKKLKVLNLFNQGVLAKLPWPAVLTRSHRGAAAVPHARYTRAGAGLLRPIRT